VDVAFAGIYGKNDSRGGRTPAAQLYPGEEAMKPRLLAAILGLILTLSTAGSWAQAERRNPLVKLTTNMGEITLELYPDKAPETVANFLAYVKAGHYDGTIFHRVINGFMIQGGGFTADMSQKPTNAPVKNEADNGLKNEAYTVAMARTQDPHSASAQFFINVKNNDFLNHTAKNMQGWGYTVFGKVTAGQGVVNKIKGVATGRKGMFDDVPVETVVIEKAEVLEQ
jgi:peptidyl-prolyl cis-trans isomerase B (cyclophilin B)